MPAIINQTDDNLIAVGACMHQVMRLIFKMPANIGQFTGRISFACQHLIYLCKSKKDATESTESAPFALLDI